MEHNRWIQWPPYATALWFKSNVILPTQPKLSTIVIHAVSGKPIVVHLLWAVQKWHQTKGVCWCWIGLAEKRKNGIINFAQVDPVDIHKSEHYSSLGFCLKFKYFLICHISCYISYIICYGKIRYSRRWHFFPTSTRRNIKKHHFWKQNKWNLVLDHLN